MAQAGGSMSRKRGRLLRANGNSSGCSRISPKCVDLVSMSRPLTAAPGSGLWSIPGPRTFVELSERHERLYLLQIYGAAHAWIDGLKSVSALPEVPQGAPEGLIGLKPAIH